MEVTAHDVANEIAMEWKRVPMMPSQDHFDRAWANIVDMAIETHGEQKVAAALSLIEGGMFNGSVPHRSPHSTRDRNTMSKKLWEFEFLGAGPGQAVRVAYAYAKDEDEAADIAVENIADDEQSVTFSRVVFGKGKLVPGPLLNKP